VVYLAFGAGRITFTEERITRIKYKNVQRKLDTGKRQKVSFWLDVFEE